MTKYRHYVKWSRGGEEGGRFGVLSIIIYLLML